MITMKKPWLAHGDTLLCFGDSLTASSTGYVKILQEKLEESDIKVINAGREGDKTPWALTRLQTEVINLKPTAVSIFLGTNDAAIGKGPWADEPMVPSEVYKWNLVWIVHICKLAGIEKFSIIPPLWRFEGDNWKIFGNIESYCNAAREAASIMKTNLVPVDVAFAEEWGRHPGHTGLLLTVDGVHLTERGNQIVADTMLKTWGIS